MSPNLIGCTHLMSVHATLLSHLMEIYNYTLIGGGMCPMPHTPHPWTLTLLPWPSAAPNAYLSPPWHPDTPSLTLMLPHHPTSVNHPMPSPCTAITRLTTHHSQAHCVADLLPLTRPTAEPPPCLPHCCTAQSCCLAPPCLTWPPHGAPIFLVFFYICTELLLKILAQKIICYQTGIEFQWQILTTKLYY